MAIFSKNEAKPLSERIQKARSEGRTQQALELSKQLAKQEPTPEHRELLRTVTFERGCQLLSDGKQRDAIVVFQNALAFEAPPEYRAAVVAKLAQAGDVATALSLFSQLPDSPDRAAAFAQAVDAALAKGAPGRGLLPPDLHAGFDTIVGAFALVEKQQDEAAREALQPISLSSPFLEWKMMLRGLIAYYQNDDARALDNWQRLDPARLPWRLVAPFRFRIDASFRAAQPDATRKRLQGLLDRMGDVAVMQSLRAFDKLLGPWDNDAVVRSAFRSARDFMHAFGANYPRAVERLGQLFYRKVAEDGTEVELELYRITFPAPADDPHLNRLQGLSAECAEVTRVAIDGWLAYEKTIQSLPDRFPAPTGTLARALVWEHIGILSRVVSSLYRRPPKGVLTPEQCYRNSIELVPGRLRPYQQLLEEMRKTPKTKKQAIAVAKSLVEKFPADAATWEYLGDALLSERKAAAAMEAYRAALKANPMQGEVRRKLADAIWATGIKLATPPARAKSGPKPEKYRPTLEEGLRFTERGPIARLAQWAIIEASFGHADYARELIAKAASLPHSRIAVPLALHAASLVEKKLAEELRQEYATRWQQALEQAPNPEEMFAGLDVLAYFDSKALRGKKQVVESILPKLTNRGLEAYSEDQLLKLGQRLLDLKMSPAAKKVADHAARRFPNSPFVQILVCDAAMAGPGGERRGPNWKAIKALENASKLVVGLPREVHERALKEIQKREAIVKPVDEMPDFFGRFFNSFLDPFGDDDDFDDDEDEFDDFGGW